MKWSIVFNICSMFCEYYWYLIFFDLLHVEVCMHVWCSCHWAPYSVYVSFVDYVHVLMSYIFIVLKIFFCTFYVLAFEVFFKYIYLIDNLYRSNKKRKESKTCFCNTCMISWYRQYFVWCEFYQILVCNIYHEIKFTIYLINLYINNKLTEF